MSISLVNAGLEMPESPDLMLGMSKSREASPKLGSRHSRKNSGAPKRFKRYGVVLPH